MAETMFLAIWLQDTTVDGATPPNVTITQVYRVFHELPAARAFVMAQPKDQEWSVAEIPVDA